VINHQSRGGDSQPSRSFAEEVFPFISALEVLVPIRKKMYRNEEEDFSYGTSNF
jgi:hypothetical protein